MIMDGGARSISYMNEFGRLTIEHCGTSEYFVDGFKSTFTYSDNEKSEYGYGTTISDSLLGLIAESDDDKIREWILDEVI